MHLCLLQGQEWVLQLCLLQGQERVLQLTDAAASWLQLPACVSVLGLP
jgi:hypothetical protein